MNMSITMRIRMLVVATAVGAVIGTVVFVPGSWNLAEANGPNTISCEANAWPHSLKSGLPAQNDKRNHVGCEDATWEYNSEIGAHTKGGYSSVFCERDSWSLRELFSKSWMPSEPSGFDVCLDVAFREDRLGVLCAVDAEGHDAVGCERDHWSAQQPDNVSLDPTLFTKHSDSRR